MRPRLFTVRNFVLILIAAILLGGSIYWVKLGMPLPGGKVPSTAGKIAFVTGTGGKSYLRMAKADGTDAVDMTETTGKALDRLPSWSPSGNDLVFVSENRTGVNPQIFEMHAMAGASVAQLTHTDTPKDSPVFGHDGRVFYLDAGKLVVTTADGGDTDALLPNHEQRTPGPGGHGDLFGAGGFQQALPAPDGKHFGVVMHTERADALLLYDSSDDQQALYLLGVAPHIHFSFLPDGGIAAVFQGAAPYQQPQTLFSKPLDDAATEAAKVNKIVPEAEKTKQIQLLLTDPDAAPADIRPPQDSKFHAVVLFDAQGNGTNILPLGEELAPDGIAVSPDGTKLVMTSEHEKGGGVFLLDLQKQGGAQLFNSAAHDVTWAPDSSQIAFAAGNDIYVVAAAGTDGSGVPQPKNITNNTGGAKSSAPVWSPAKPPKP